MGTTDLTIDGVLDIECQDWDTFVMGALRTERGITVRDHTDEETLIDDILKVQGSVWCHFGGRYDMQWFLATLRRMGCPIDEVKIVMAGARIISVQVEKTTLRDSFALIPMSLEKAAQMTNTPKLETGLPCNCGKCKCDGPHTTNCKCKGFCSIRRDMPPHLRARLREYLVRDCDALWNVLHTVFNFAADHQIYLRSTVGASAWATASEQCGIDKANWTEGRSRARLYYFARDGYFGGRVQSFTRYSDSGFRYDINAAYPWSLTAVNVPHGARYEVLGAEAWKTYTNGMEGVYRAIVSVPDALHIPPLPVRDDTAHRIVYPTGRFSGTWTGLELRYAESCGARVDRIVRGLAWRESGPIYRAFCERIYALRDAAGAKTALGQWLKWLANSQTGKLAQRPEREHVSMFNENPVTKLCPADGICRRQKKGAPDCGDVCCVHRCSKRCGGWRPISTDLAIWTRRVFHLAPCSHVQHAAYLTANVRTYWHHHATIDPMATVYGDTDSLFLERPVLPPEVISEHRLGGFKFEGTYRAATFLAPKTYGYTDGETGKFVAKAKGIPDAETHWTALVKGEKIPIDSGVHGLLTAARRYDSLFLKQESSRSLHPTEGRMGDRLIGSDGRTYPPKIGA